MFEVYKVLVSYSEQRNVNYSASWGFPSFFLDWLTMVCGKRIYLARECQMIFEFEFDSSLCHHTFSCSGPRSSFDSERYNRFLQYCTSARGQSWLALRLERPDPIREAYSWMLHPQLSWNAGSSYIGLRDHDN